MHKRSLLAMFLVIFSLLVFLNGCAAVSSADQPVSLTEQAHQSIPAPKIRSLPDHFKP